MASIAESNESILNSVKVQLGIPASHTEFDQMIQLDINTAFGTLYQLGVGPDTPFTIEDESDTWDAFFTQPNTEMAKTFVALTVRQLFDPPTGTAAEALNRQLDEITWRLSIAVNEAERSEIEQE